MKDALKDDAGFGNSGLASLSSLPLMEEFQSYHLQYWCEAAVYSSK
jgi:hypothetical protein